MRKLACIFLSFFSIIQMIVGESNLRCPESKAAWKERASAFNCSITGTKYHCVMDDTEKLVEVCIVPLNVTGSVCPVVHINELTPYWVFPPSSCPTQNKDCPQDAQGVYSSDEVFKYPACFVNVKIRESSEAELQFSTMRSTATTAGKTGTSTIQNNYLYGSPIINIISVSTGLFAIVTLFLVILIMLQSRENGKRMKSAIFAISHMQKGTSRTTVASEESVLDKKLVSFTDLQSKDKAIIEIYN